MKKTQLNLMLILSLSLCLGIFSKAHADDKKQEAANLTIPWDEFKKLLRIDENDIVISLETFQKLLVQTGIKNPPEHVVVAGNVVLSREEFNKLVSQMKPPSGDETDLPFEYLITKAIYSGKMEQENTEFTGTFHIHLLKEGKYLKIPILPQTIALKDVSIDEKQALVLSENGYHQLVLSKSGEHVVVARFSIKSSLKKGPHKIDISIQQTPITLLNLELPLGDIDVEIPEAQQLLTRAKNNTTTVSAIITPGNLMSIRWRKKVVVQEKLPPKLYCEAYHLISIEDDALKVNSDIKYNILHSEIDGVRLALPEDMNVLTVTGEGIGEWQEMNQQEQRLINVPFTYSKMGTITIQMTAEKPLSEGGLANEFSGIRVLDIVRETGFIGIELNTSAEVKIAESQGLERVAVQKLPGSLSNKSVKPLMYGFKYIKHPFSLVLDIEKHEKIGVPMATINSANVVTLFTEDGKIVHRLIYQVRNSAKQFLEIQLPPKADVWSVFVGNDPVESSINSEGKLLVPLIRSRSVNNRLDTFPIEVIYCLVNNNFSPLSFRNSALPAVDLLISQLIWSVYLPNDYAYLYFKSTLEKEEIIRGVNVFAGKGRQFNGEVMQQIAESESKVADEANLKKAYRGKDYQSQFRNLPLKEEQLKSQVDAELKFSTRLEGISQQAAEPAQITGGTSATGIMPIQIEVPTGGQVYRFAKTIVKSEDPLTVKFFYVQYWIIRTIKWLIILIVILILCIKRKKIERILQKATQRYDASQKPEAMIRKYAESKITIFVLFCLFLISLSFSRFLAFILGLLFFLSLIYQFIILRRKRLARQSKLEVRDDHEKLNGM